MKIEVSLMDLNNYIQKEILWKEKNCKLLLNINDIKYCINNDGKLCECDLFEEIWIVEYVTEEKQMYYTCKAINDNEAKRIALRNKAFFSNINLKDFNKDYIKAYKCDIKDIRSDKLYKLFFNKEDLNK